MKTQKEVLGLTELQELLGCGRSLASQKLQEIKKISDTLNIRGKCHRLDYELWISKNKEVNNDNVNEKMKPVLTDLIFSLKRTTNLLEKLLD